MNVKFFCSAVVVCFAIFFTGCLSMEKYQMKAEEKVLLYLRENGTTKTDKYIDKLVVEEKLTKYQADKLKEIIHSALAKIEDVLAEKVEPTEDEVKEDE